jgi:hypothetical protein
VALVQTDYPDFGRDVQTESPLLLNLNAVVLNASQTDGPVFVGDTPYINVRFTANNGARLTLNWFSDEAMTQALTLDQITVQNGEPALMHVPVGGPWMQTVILPGVFPTTVTCQLSPARTFRQGHGSATGAPVALSSFTAALAAAGVLTVPLTKTIVGPATITIDSPAATWTCTIQDISHVGGVGTICAVRNTTYNGPFTFYFPRCSCQMVFTNTSAAAASVRLIVAQVFQ